MSQINLDARSAAIEREAKANDELVKAWLALAEIAVPAVLRAAAAGNVTCKEAAREMTPFIEKARGAR